MKQYNLAVVGATGAVGREMLNTLAQRDFPINNIYALASRKSVGKEVSFGDYNTLRVSCADDFNFSKVDICLFSVGSEKAKIFAPRAADSGAVVIDNSSAFRMNDNSPLIIPEVNLHHLKDYSKSNIIANPNCVVIQMLVALKPLHDVAKIKRIVVSTYQSVSGAGKEAMDELYNQTKAMLTYQTYEIKKFPRQISFNVIPQAGAFQSNGYTDEEEKIVNETHKILDPQIKVTATCVRVPVFVGHSISVNVEFHDPMTAAEANNILSEAEGIIVVDDASKDDYATPKDVIEDTAVLVSRIRADKTVKYGLNMWIVGDNLRKGAALNAVQIAEELIRDYI